jgi:uncharacterized membrane protein
VHEPATDRTIVAAAFAAVAVFVVTWSLLHFGFYTHKQITDTGVYQRYGHHIAHGQVPYRDFKLEYPPGALPVFILPGLVSPGPDGEHLTRGFRRTFETLMWMCGAVALCAMAFILRQLRASALETWSALLLAALAPLALGSVILSRFDLWPAALATVALAALLGGWVRTGHAVLGLAMAAKFYPGVLLPLGIAYVWRRWSRREALICLAWALGVFVAVFLPFVVLAPGGVWHSVSVQLGRPLQVESLGAALLLAAHHTFGLGVTSETSHGSQNLAGIGADAVGVVTTILQSAILIWIWVTFARGPATKAFLVRASVACVCTFIAFGKVLSPQFLIWLIPVVPLVRGRRGALAAALLLAALILTQIWFPFRYFRLSLDFEEGLSWVLLARDLVLVALSALLVTSLRHRHA